MAQTYLLKVKEVNNNTTDTKTLVFDVPAHLSSVFDYEPGQYLTLEFNIDGKKERRAYSMSSSPLTETAPAVTVKRFPGGLISNHINDNVVAGDEINLLPPYGNFVPQLNESNAKHYVLISAGSGITPIISILKSILSFEKESKVSLLYGNRNEESIIFHQELKQLQEKYADRLNLELTLSQAPESWSGLVGRIDAQKISDFVFKYANDDSQKEYFICGPSGMIETTEQSLTEMKIDPKFIHKEYFILPKKDPEPEVTQAIQDAGKQMIKVILDNEEFEVEVSPNETVLDAALEKEIDAPFSCMAAACATCRAKVLSGTVIMDDREMLSDEEIAEGYVLTCQAHPTSADVVISYDE